jgi:hypothetical protein
MAGSLAVIQLKGLLGDCLGAQIGWAHLHPDQRLTVVVPEDGPYEYLRRVWEMSSLSAEVIPLPDARVSSPDLERRSRIRAAELLARKGYRRLLTLASEDFALGDPEAFYAPWFDDVVSGTDSFFHQYAAPDAIRLRIPDAATHWARSLLESRGIGAFVIAHNRDAIGGARMREAGSRHSDPLWNDMRNFRLEPLVDAALRVLPPETHVIRIGTAGQPICPRARFLDTIPMALDLCQQVALISLCRAYLSGASGPATFAWLLKKPMLTVNNPMLGAFLTQEGVPMVGLEKHVLVEGCPREPTDVPLLEGGGGPGRLSSDCGYALEENSQAEIESALVEIERLIAAGRGDHLVLSNGTFRSLAQLASRYTGFSFDGRQTGFHEVFMAFERAIREFRTPLMQLVFSRFAPSRRVCLGLFGAATTGRQVLADFRREVCWDIRFFDNDAARHQTVLDGAVVCPPATLSRHSIDLVVITSRSGVLELDERLAADGWVRGVNLFHHDDALPGPATFRLDPDLCGRVRASAERHLGEPLIPATSSVQV